MSEGIGKYVDIDVTINADAIYNDASAVATATAKEFSDAKKAAEQWVDTTVVSPVVEGYNSVVDTAKVVGSAVAYAGSEFGNDVAKTATQYANDAQFVGTVVSNATSEFGNDVAKTATQYANDAQFVGTVVSNATSGFGNDVAKTTTQQFGNAVTGAQGTLGYAGLLLASAGLWLTNTATGVDLTKK